MINDIIEPNIDYDFSKLYLGPPSTLSGGAYFTRIMHGNNKQLYIQTPKSLTKQGFVKSGKKIYTDLMFDNNDTIFINWIENLENKCQELIFNKSDKWFENKLEKDDIESAFTSPFKIFKSGKFYLLRVNVKPTIKIYDESDQIIKIEDVTDNKTIISILEIQGIKFTSRNFQIEIELKQSMVVSPDPFLDNCFIKKPIKEKPIKEVTITEPIIDTEPNIDSESNSNSNSNSLEEFINESAKDLSNDTFNTNNNSFDLIPIDLETTFDEKNTKQDYVEDNNVKDNNVKENKGFIIEDENIVLDVEDLSEEVKEEEDPNILKEVDLTSSLEKNLETITLKKPNQVYYEIYKKAREKAKETKKAAIVAYLEAKNIKKTYMLDDIDESDSDSDGYFNENDEDSENNDL